MQTARPRRQARKTTALLLLTFALLAGSFPRGAALAQIAPALMGEVGEDALPKRPAASPFRIETLPVGADAQLLTVFGSLQGLRPEGSAAPGTSDVPLVSVLRDTLGDSDPENDRLRHVWMLTYTRPTALQRVAAAVEEGDGRGDAL